MSKINIDDIRKEVELYNWKVISTEYKNLESEMVFECPEGHEVFNSWKKMRQKLECPVCKKNVYKDQNTSVIPKDKGILRVLALDQASHVTGWSIYDGEKLVKYGIFKTKSYTEAKRINEVKVWLINMINNWKPDFVGLEDIYVQLGPYNPDAVNVLTFKVLAHLQGVLIDTLVENKIEFEVCSASTWRSHCGVKGRTKPDKKRSMQIKVKQFFDVNVTDDEADAIGIGKYIADKAAGRRKIINWE